MVILYGLISVILDAITNVKTEWPILIRQSIFMGIFLTFFFEIIKKIRNKNDKSDKH